MFAKLRIYIPIALVLICLICCGSVAEATGGYLEGYEETNPQPTGVSWWSTLAYLFSLFAVFAVVLVMAYFAARFIGGRFNAARMSASGGRILENLPLGPNRSVCTVEMAGRVFLLGVFGRNNRQRFNRTFARAIDCSRRYVFARIWHLVEFSKENSSVQKR